MQPDQGVEFGEHEADREAVEIKIAGLRVHSFQSFQWFQWFQMSERRAVVFVLTCACPWPIDHPFTSGWDASSSFIEKVYNQQR